MMILSSFCEHPKEEKGSVLHNIKGPRVSTTLADTRLSYKDFYLQGRLQNDHICTLFYYKWGSF